jgi:hypothetical protein
MCTAGAATMVPTRLRLDLSASVAGYGAASLLPQPAASSSSRANSTARPSAAGAAKAASRNDRNELDSC